MRNINVRQDFISGTRPLNGPAPFGANGFSSSGMFSFLNFYDSQAP
jgi:hypothetical protein